MTEHYINTYIKASSTPGAKPGLLHSAPKRFHFKTLTNMTPFEYQKHLRLQEARRLMLSHAMDASAAAYHVGYASRSQFTREYSPLFGAPPIRNVEQIRQQSQPEEL
jgi:AraC-like DNA-binding protein